MPTPEARHPLSLNPQFLTKEGQTEFVVLPYEEFVALRELAEDAEDLMDLRAAKAESPDEPSLTLEQARAELGLG